MKTFISILTFTSIIFVMSSTAIAKESAEENSTLEIPIIIMTCNPFPECELWPDIDQASVKRG